MRFNQIKRDHATLPRATTQEPGTARLLRAIRRTQPASREASRAPAGPRARNASAAVEQAYSFTRATASPAVVVADPFFCHELSLIEEAGFTNPDTIEEHDLAAHAAHQSAWPIPYVCHATHVAIDRMRASGLNRSDLPRETGVERTALSKMHHHGEASMINFVRVVTRPELAEAGFDYSGQGVKNLCDREAIIAAMKATAPYHGLSQDQIADFEGPDYEVLCSALRAIPPEVLRRPVPEAVARQVIHGACGNGGQDLALPWFSPGDQAKINRKTAAFTTCPAPGECVSDLLATWLRTLIHTYYTLELANPQRQIQSANDPG